MLKIEIEIANENSEMTTVFFLENITLAIFQTHKSIAKLYSFKNNA